MSQADLPYVARCQECGRIVAMASAEMPRRDLAKSLAAWARDGLSIERSSKEDAIAETWGHDGCKWDRRTPKEKAAMTPLYQEQ